MKTLESCIQIVNGTPKVISSASWVGTRLCISCGGTRELLVREVHEGSLVGHFGESKTLIMLREHYYWPAIEKGV